MSFEEAINPCKRMYIDIYIFVYAYVCMDVCVCVACEHVETGVEFFIAIRFNLYMYIYINTYVQIYVYIHICIYLRPCAIFEYFTVPGQVLCRVKN